MKNKNALTKPNTNANQKESALLGNVFKLEYSLKYHEVTKYTTPLGYFHDMQLLVVAPDMKEATKTLKLWHDDGEPEAIKATDLGRCVKWPNETSPSTGATE